jgi:hypothetical protein
VRSLMPTLPAHARASSSAPEKEVELCVNDLPQVCAQYVCVCVYLIAKSPGGLTSPVFRAYGSASLFRARTLSFAGITICSKFVKCTCMTTACAMSLGIPCLWQRQALDRMYIHCMCFSLLLQDAFSGPLNEGFNIIVLLSQLAGTTPALFWLISQPIRF